MWLPVLLFTVKIEEAVEQGDFRLQGKAKLYGALNLYLACLFGHRSSVHLEMTDQMVQTAAASGSDTRGYAIQVRIVTIQFISKALNLVEHCFASYLLYLCVLTFPLPPPVSVNIGHQAQVPKDFWGL